jgi:hypothetical protein
MGERCTICGGAIQVRKSSTCPNVADELKAHRPCSSAGHRQPALLESGPVNAWLEFLADQLAAKFLGEAPTTRDPAA